MIYTHVIQLGGQGVPSPLDDLGVDLSFVPVNSLYSYHIPKKSLMLSTSQNQIENLKYPANPT